MPLPELLSATPLVSTVVDASLVAGAVDIDVSPSLDVLDPSELPPPPHAAIPTKAIRRASRSETIVRSCRPARGHATASPHATDEGTRRSLAIARERLFEQRHEVTATVETSRHDHLDRRACHLEIGRRR